MTKTVVICDYCSTIIPVDDVKSKTSGPITLHIPGTIVLQSKGPGLFTSGKVFHFCSESCLLRFVSTTNRACPACKETGMVSDNRPIESNLTQTLAWCEKCGWRGEMQRVGIQE